MARQTQRSSISHIHFSRIMVIISMIVISSLCGAMFMERVPRSYLARGHHVDAFESGIGLWLLWVVAGIIAGICMNRVYYPVGLTPRWSDWRSLVLLGFGFSMVIWTTLILLAFYIRQGLPV